MGAGLMEDVKVSTTVPASWAAALERLARKRDPIAGKRTKAGMLRSGLRLYLQFQIDDENEWQALDLGPIERAEPPSEVIEATAEEVPLDPNELPARVWVRP